MTTIEPGTDRLLVADLVGLLGDAEHYNSRRSTSDSRLDYLDRRAALLHRLVDAVGDESSRYLAQDAEDRAEDLRARAEAIARECGDPPPAGRRLPAPEPVHPDGRAPRLGDEDPGIVPGSPLTRAGHTPRVQTLRAPTSWWGPSVFVAVPLGRQPGDGAPPVSVISSPITTAAAKAVTRLDIVPDPNPPDLASEDSRAGAGRTTAGTDRVHFPLVRWMLAPRTTWQARRLAADFGEGIDARTAWAMARLARHPDERGYAMAHLDDERRAAG